MSDNAAERFREAKVTNFRKLFLILRGGYLPQIRSENEGRQAHRSRSRRRRLPPGGSYLDQDASASRYVLSVHRTFVLRLIFGDEMVLFGVVLVW